MGMNYQKQAQDFADKVGLTMTAIYTGHRARFGEHITAVYSITLTRKGRSYTFDFSTSINDSWQHREDGKYTWKSGLPYKLNLENFFKSELCHQEYPNWSYFNIHRTKKAPTMYDILACLTKSDPGSFKDFCADYGYDEDSRKAFEVYVSVQKEWEQVNNLFHDVLDELKEIT